MLHCNLNFKIDFEDKTVEESAKIIRKMKHLITELAEENSVEVVKAKDTWKV